MAYFISLKYIIMSVENIYETIDVAMLTQGLHTGPVLGDEGPNAVHCKTCSVLLCVLEQPKVENYSTWPLKRGTQLGTIGPVGLRPALSTY